MSRVSMPAALVAAALTFGVTVPATAAAYQPGVTVAAVEAVTGARVAPASGRTEVLINVSGDVRIEDFALENPHRIVLDLHGARLGMPADAYDRQSRGVLRNLRFSQYRDDVVRVVIDLDASRAYSILDVGGAVRVAIEGGATFAEWSAGRSEAARSTAVVGAPEILEQEPAVVQSQPAPVSLASQPAQRNTRDEAFSSAPGASPIAQSQARRISVTYDHADIRDVIAAFGSFSGRTIVTGRDVQGEVTAEIKDQPWDIALNAILTAQGLAASQEAGGIITVDSYKNILARQSSEPLVTRLIQVNYAPAGSLVETVQSLLSRDCAGFTAGAGGAAGAGAGGASQCITRGQVIADSGTNTLVISEVPSRITEITGYIRQLDVRTPQVAIKAKIISVNRTQTEQLGLSYDLGNQSTFFNTLAPRVDGGGSTIDGEFVVSLGGSALAGVANANRKYRQGSALSLIFTTMLGKYSLTTFLDALSEAQLSDVQAEPSIVTLDNRTARVLVGQETPIRVIDAGSQGQVGQAPRATVEFKETGIILEVTPHITNNRQILMNVSAEQSAINNIGGDLGYVFDKRQARSQVLVGDGETAVVGGLTQTSITRNRSGIPILSRLPLIGALFSQTDSREVKQDLLILLTPRIVDEGENPRR